MGGFRGLAPGCFLAGWLDALPSLAERAGGTVDALVAAVDSGESAAAPFFREALDAAAEAGCAGCSRGGRLQSLFDAFQAHLDELEDGKSRRSSARMARGAGKPSSTRR